MNYNNQNYRGLPLRLVPRDDYRGKRAKLYYIGKSIETMWIPNSYLNDDGTIKAGCNFMWLFKGREQVLYRAGYEFKY